MKKILNLMIIALVVLVVGCKTTEPTGTTNNKEPRFRPYTTYIKEKYKITNEEEKMLQYYNSTEFSLYTSIDSTYKDIGTKIRGQKVTYNDEIVFGVMKPCVLVQNTGGTFWVRFEPGEYRDIPYEQNSNGEYEFVAEKVKYATREYEVSATGSLILVDFEDLERVVNNRREVPGMKIGESSKNLDSPINKNPAVRDPVSTPSTTQPQSQPAQAPQNKTPGKPTLKPKGG